MHGFRALLAGLLISGAIGTLAWYSVQALRHLLRAWLANGCSLDVIFSGVNMC
jgi:hypothetical protein